MLDMRFLHEFYRSAEFDDARLIAWDMDGVVGHTEPHQMRAFKQFAYSLSRIRDTGYTFTELVQGTIPGKPRLLGQTELNIIRILKDEYGIPDDYSVERLLEMRAQAYVEVVTQDDVLNEYAANIMQQAHYEHKRQILLSNGRGWIQEKLCEQWGVLSYLSEIRTIDKRIIEDKVKYLLTYCVEYNIQPSQIILFEDSVSTIKNAEEVGITCVYVPHTLSPEPAFVPKSGLVLPHSSIPRTDYAKILPMVHPHWMKIAA